MKIPNDNTRKTTHFLHISQTFRETDEKENFLKIYNRRKSQQIWIFRGQLYI